MTEDDERITRRLLTLAPGLGFAWGALAIGLHLPLWSLIVGVFTVWLIAVVLTVPRPYRR